MDRIKDEIHDMSEKIYELQNKTEHLTNGQRYAAINEIEKSIAPLRNDLHHLEHKLYKQQHNEEEIEKEVNQILSQIAELENLKSDLIARINTETEHTRKYYHDEVMQFMKNEITPLHDSVVKHEQEIAILKSDIKKEFAQFRLELAEANKKREVEDAKKFDKINILIAGSIGVVGGLGTLFMYFQPVLQTFVKIFFG